MDNDIVERLRTLIAEAQLPWRTDFCDVIRDDPNDDDPWTVAYCGPGEGLETVIADGMNALPAVLSTIETLTADLARVTAERDAMIKANGLRMAELHKERAEAKLWFEKAQEWRIAAEQAVLDRLRNLPDDVASHIAQKHCFSYEVAKIVGKDLANALADALQTQPTEQASNYRVVCETVGEVVAGRTDLPVKRIEHEDDGTISVIVDHWPQASQSTSDAMRDALIADIRKQGKKIEAERLREARSWGGPTMCKPLGLDELLDAILAALAQGPAIQDSRLKQLIAESRTRVDAMTPAEREAMLHAQRESWARAMAPCEHGDRDWETCPECLIIYRSNANA